MLKIYYGCHIILNIAFLSVFSSNIQFHVLSLVPIFLIALMLFQISFFEENMENDSDGDTAYSVGNTIKFTKEEQACQLAYLKYSFLICVPFEFPLIYFMSSYWKILGVLLYFLAHIIGGVVFKVKYGKAIRERINMEKKDLEEQMRREELGMK